MIKEERATKLNEIKTDIEKLKNIAKRDEQLSIELRSYLKVGNCPPFSVYKDAEVVLSDNIRFESLFETSHAEYCAALLYVRKHYNAVVAEIKKKKKELKEVEKK